MKTSMKPATTIADGVAWKSLKNLVHRFHLDVDEARIVMGDMALSTYYKGINKLEGKLTRDEKERISLLLGIYKDLRILFMDSEQAMTWIDRENTLPPFNGLTPRQFMLDGSLMRLADVRRFLDFWRGY